MPDCQVPRGGVAKLEHIDGELKVGNKARIEASSGKLVFVSKGAYFAGAALVNCDFECDSLHVAHGGTLEVRGDLIVHKMLDVDHSIDVSGLIRAGEIDVGGRIYSNTIECEGRTKVGGFLDVKEKLQAQSVDVGGTAESGEVKLQDLNVGGVAKVRGGAIPGKIRVGGKFESTAPLEFGDLRVIGKILLPANCKGEKISTFGRLSATGDFECNELENKGRMEIKGNCKSQRIESSGRLTVKGSLEVSNEFDTWGTAKISGVLKGSNLRIAGSFEAERALVSNEIELVGQAATRDGMKGDLVYVRSGSKYMGVLVGNKVEIGKSYGVVSNWTTKWAGQNLGFRLVGRETRVGDIYAKEVHLGRASRCGKVFAEVVELEEGCIVEEINYTKELCGESAKSFINRPFPKKVTLLPNPPL
jgi:cytoskeletal protein CcmA (bactofilin family)